MRKNRLLIMICTGVMAVLLAGCKPSDEKMAEVTEALSGLASAREEAEERYLDLVDTGYREELDKLNVQAADIEAMDFSQMRDKNIDDVLPTIRELTYNYTVIEDKLNGKYKEEAAENAEAAKNLKIPAYFMNKSELTFCSIILHDMSEDEYSENFLQEGSTLAPGFTLMGVTLEVYGDSGQFEFVIKDSDGREYKMPCENLSKADPDGVSLVFEYDSNAGAGSVSFGGYFSN